MIIENCTPCRRQSENPVELASNEEQIKHIKSRVIASFTVFKQEFEQAKKEISELRSESDQVINDMYHTIEMTNFSASQGYKFAKNLKIALQNRRMVKKVYSVFDSLFDRLTYYLKEFELKVDSVFKK